MDSSCADQPLLSKDGIRMLDIARETGYNTNHLSSDFPGFGIDVGITIGKHNHSFEMLSRCMRYFNTHNIVRVRFNNFFDHGKRHPELVLSENEIREVYRNLKLIHETIPLNFQLGISEDLGTLGIETLGLPSNAGTCKAESQLFGIIPSKEPYIKWLDQYFEYAAVGEVVGCVNVFEPILGELVRRKNRVNGEIEYMISFFPDDIEKLQRKRLDGTCRQLEYWQH